MGEIKILIHSCETKKSFTIAMLKRCSVKLTSKKQFAVVGVCWEEVREGGGAHGSAQDHHGSEVLKLFNCQVPTPSQGFVQDGLQVLD